MFFQVASFELRHQLRQPVYWVIVAIFFLLVFGATTSEQISFGLGPNDYKNGPFAIAIASLNAVIFFMFVTTAVVASVAVRDEETGFTPIIRSTRIGKFDYLIGRFSGAFAASAVAFLAVPLAVFVGSLMPWLDREAVGPFRLEPYLWSYLVLGLPGLFLSAAAFFALSTLTRSMMATYLGVVLFLVIWFIARTWARQIELDRAAALLEPFGASAYSLATRYWTTAERNTIDPALSGLLLANRLLAIALGAVLLAGAYTLFRFEHRAPRKARRAAQQLPSRAAAPQVRAAPRPRLAPRFGPGMLLAQLAARTRLDMGQVFLSPGYIVLLAIAVILSAANMWRPDQLGLFGTGIHPVTRVMVQQLGNFPFLCIVIAIYYAGDLVWRERDRRTHELVDSTPVPDWAFVVPKTAAIVLVLITTLAMGVVTGVIIQAAKGWYDFQLDKYLLWYLLPNAVDLFPIAALAVFLQALSPHKVIGWAGMVLYMVALLTLPGLGIEHHLLLYGTGPYVPLSDMNGMGRFWVGAAWFRLYWCAAAVILVALAYGLWRRGAETQVLPRLRRLPGRLRSLAGWVIFGSLAVFAGAGVWIFINTNIWNSYRSQLDEDRWLADYEKALLPFETVPQPKIAQEALDVNIRPDVPRVVTHGIYLLENRSAAPLREIHVRFPRDLILTSLSIEGARPKTTYDRFNYRIFAFDTPMLPGERRHMAFETVLTQRGFKNERDLVQVLHNGSFLNDRAIAPTLGMERRDLLQDRRKRARYGLPRELRMPALGTPGADQVNYIGHDSDWVLARMRVTTDADQTPVAPTYQELDRVAGGRRTAEFRTDAPILRFFSVQSARYAVRRETYKGVNLAVFHHPPHDWNVGRMLKAAKASLDYFQANFSPYQFHQLRFIEFPAPQGRFAQSFANTVPWSEDLGFIADLPKDASEIDYVTYVGAHEVAHQWWAHQVIGADEQGSTALSETLAQYSALMVMKRMYGQDMIRRFLKYELDRYLRARGGDPLPEQPLERVEDQPYIYYRKGSLVMYRLQDEIGEAAVNRALRGLLTRYAFKGPPYPTSLDLVAAIRAEAPADKQALITDLFEKITLYDLKTTRASARRRPDGRWDVSLTVTAGKLYADGRGKETSSPLNETLDVGLFAAEPGKAGFDPSKVIAFQRLPIRSGTQTLHLIVARKPAFAGVDPYNKLIDRNADDNTIRVGG
jgi:ABC-2 type transport system permease protein